MAISRCILLKMGNLSNKIFRENQNTYFMFSNFFPKIVTFIRKRRIIWCSQRTQTIWRMRVACWISKMKSAKAHACAVHLHPHASSHSRTHMLTHTHTHTEKYVIQGGSNMTGTNCDLFTHKSSRSYLNHLVLITFPHQQWFGERASMLRIYVNC
jgi:hypothetical protein